MEEVSLRRMKEEDLAAADELRRLAGWNQTLEDWHGLLWLEPHGCFVAVQKGHVVGTVTTTTYGQTLAWIGMMLVHPDHRQRGIGTRLMRQALEYLQSRQVHCVKLDATPTGRPVYEKLGFVPEWSLTRWQRLATTEIPFSSAAGPSTRPLSDADWDAIEKIDNAIVGASRSRLLHSLAERSEAVLVWPAHGNITGCGMLRS